MEKQLFTIGYWLGLTCTAIALIFRLVTFFNVTALHIGPSGGNAIGYSSFFHGAVLFFLLAIASWCRIAKD
jgi:hypothetical protein